MPGYCSAREIQTPAACYTRSGRRLWPPEACPELDARWKELEVRISRRRVVNVVLPVLLVTGAVYVVCAFIMRFGVLVAFALLVGAAAVSEYGGNWGDFIGYVVFWYFFYPLFYKKSRTS